MWTNITRPKYERDLLRYASDLTDGEWKVRARTALRPHAGVVRAVGVIPSGDSVNSSPLGKRDRAPELIRGKARVASERQTNRTQCLARKELSDFSQL